MVQRYVVIILILCPIVSYGQFGINAKYLFGQSEALDTYQLSQDGLQVSLEYSFRLKEKRLEFHPGLGYRFTFFKELDLNSNLDEDDLGYFTSMDLDFNTSIYPFDFGGDCDCPTWSKDGNLIKKGFFLEVSPGIAYQTMHRDFYWSDPHGPEVPIKSTNLAWKLSIGAGIDIGLSEEFTLTPLFSWTKISNEVYERLTDYGSTAELDDQTYLATGLRMTYKPDPKRRRRF